MSTISAFGNRTLEQLKVPELKEELRKRGILPKGLKKELMERLEQALKEENQEANFGGEFVTEDAIQNAFPQGSELQEDATEDFKLQEDRSMDDTGLDGIKPQEDVFADTFKPQENAVDFESHQVELDVSIFHKDEPDSSKPQEDLPEISKPQEDVTYSPKPQEDSRDVFKPQEDAPDVSRLQEHAPDAFKPQEAANLEVPKENDSSDAEKVTLEPHSGHEVFAVPSPFLSNEVKTEFPLAKAIPVAEEVKTLHPLPAEGKSMEAICSSEEQTKAAETSLPVTTAFEIASNEDMETNVIVQSVPGLGHDSDLLPRTLCEAGYRSHTIPSASKGSLLSASLVSVNSLQIGDSIEKPRQNVEANQIDLYPMHSEGQYKLFSEQMMVVDSAVPSENVDGDNALVTSFRHFEHEAIARVSLPIVNDTPFEVKAASQMSSDILRENFPHGETNVAGVSESSGVDSERFVDPVDEKSAKASEFVETVESLIPEEIHLEDKGVEASIPEQVFTENKIVEKSLLISETPITKLDSLAETVARVPESATGEASVGVMKTPKDTLSLVKEDRRTEPRRQFEEKIRSREGLDVRKEEYEIKKFDREAPRDRRELSRSRLSQEGIAKVKEEVEKARPKDRGQVDSGFRRSEPRVKRELVEEKIDLRTVKEDLGGKGDLGRIDNESKERDVKPMDIDSGGLKRKESDEDSRQVEPLKRQRRWNSGKNLERQSELKLLSKSMITERQKDIIPTKTETGNDSSLPASMLSPASSRDLTPVFKGPPIGSFDQLSGSKHASYTAKTDDASNGYSMQRRMVPAPTRSPTTSLRIDRFLRPFTLPAVKELLARTGTYHNFWMDHIKSHCYVTYSTVEEAIATRNTLYNLQWPPTGGKTLVAEFVDPEEVELKCESANDKPIATAVTTPRPAASSNDQISPSTGRSTGRLPAPILAPPPPAPQREKPTLPPRKVQEPSIPNLDDIFKKTGAKPPIYYLPLTDEQVEAKLARIKASVNKVTTRA